METVMQNAHNASKNTKLWDVTGVLLAGGKSRRMGQDKALLELEGEPLFRRSLNLLHQLCGSVLISGERPDLAPPGVPAIADTYPGSSLGGIYTGLEAAPTAWIFVAPCDMPYPNWGIAAALLNARFIQQGVDAVVPYTECGSEPVFALYHKRCMPIVENMLREEKYRIREFLRHIPVKHLDCTQHSREGERHLLNINTPEDLASLKKGGAHSGKAESECWS